MPRRALIGLACFSGVLLIGWLDWISGPELGLSLLYLIPIVFAAWYGGVAIGVPVACTAAASWLAADIGWREGQQATAVSLWNAFTRLVIYVSQAILIALVHKDRERLKELAARESALARRDVTTSLLNTRGFLEAAEAEIARASAERTPVIAIYIDLDNFKQFNDLLGHAAGDDVLTEVARVLTMRLRPGDHAARIGGDEFAMLLPGASAEYARIVAEEVVAALKYFGSAYPDVGFGATAGIAVFEKPPRDAEALLRAADDAMYIAKNAGKGQVAVDLTPSKT